MKWPKPTPMAIARNIQSVRKRSRKESFFRCNGAQIRPCVYGVLDIVIWPQERLDIGSGWQQPCGARARTSLPADVVELSLNCELLQCGERQAKAKWRARRVRRLSWYRAKAGWRC